MATASSSPVSSGGGSGVVSLIPFADLDLTLERAIDARDKEGKWVAAIIKKLSNSERTPSDGDHLKPPFTCDRAKVRFVRVNFVGWEAKWDEWISVIPSTHHSCRLQPPGRFTTGNGSKPALSDSFSIGREVTIYRMTPLPRTWNVAKVIDTDGRQIRVGFMPIPPFAHVSTSNAVKRDYWFHTASDEVWHGNAIIALASIPVPASMLSAVGAARLSISKAASTATAATATAATASSAVSSVQAKSNAIAAAVNHAAAANAAAAAASPMLVSPKNNGTASAAASAASVRTHSRTATPPSPFSAAKAAAAAAQAATAIPKLSLSTGAGAVNGSGVMLLDDFDVVKLVKTEKSIDVRDRDGRWRPATILDRTSTAASAAAANGKSSADHTAGSAAGGLSKVQIRYADATDLTSVDAKEWIDLDRASYRIQPYQRCSLPIPAAAVAAFEYRINDSVFVSPPAATSVSSLVPSGMNAVWYVGTVRSVAPPQVLIEYAPAAASVAIGTPRGSITTPTAARPTPKREWFHPVFQHICRELPTGANIVSSTATTATLPSNGRTPPLSPSALNMRTLSVNSPAKPEAATKSNGASTPTAAAAAAASGTAPILIPGPQLLSASDVKPRALVDARDNIGKWIQAEILAITPPSMRDPFAQVEVHYVGWDPKWDEVLIIDDSQRALMPRLAKTGFFSGSSTSNVYRPDETVYVLAQPPRDASRYVEVTSPTTAPFRWWAVDGWVSARVLQCELAQLYVEYTPDPVTIAYSQSQYSQSPASSQNGGSVKRWFHLDRNEIRSPKVPLPSFPPAAVAKKLSISNGTAAAAVIPNTPITKSVSGAGGSGQVLVSGPLGTLSVPPPIPALAPSIGLVCDCRDREGRWCESKVVGQSQDGRWRVHFLDWDSKYDEDLTTAQFTLRSAPYLAFTPTQTARFTAVAGRSAAASLYRKVGSVLFDQYYNPKTAIGARVYVFRFNPEPRNWIEATIRRIEVGSFQIQVTYPVPVTATQPNGVGFSWFHVLSGEILPVHPNTVLSPDSPCALAAVTVPSAAAVAASNAASQLFQYLHTVIARRSSQSAAATPDKKSAPASKMDVEPDSSALDDDERAMTPAGKLGSAEDPLREWATASVSKQAEKKLPYDFRALVGFRNVGNSCYMNAAVQAICALPPIINFFVQKRAHHLLSCSNPRAVSHTKTRGRLVPEFAFLADRLYDSDPEPGQSIPVLSPAGLKHVTSVLSDRFGGYDQQDSHEFLNVLLDGLHHELNVTGTSAEAKSLHYPKSILDTSFTAAMAATGKPEPAAIRADKTWKRHLMYNQSIISTLFYGLLQNKTTCASCAYTSLAFETFSSISLDLPSAKGKWSLFSSGSVSLSQCFDEFTRVEKLGGGDWNCENCKTKRHATKQLLLWSLPPVLFVQLKRFAPDGSRVNSGVEYPLELNVKEWCDPAARTAAQSNPAPAKLDSGLPAFPAYPLAGSSSYRLHAVVLHYGRYRHYTAVTKARYIRQSTGEAEVGWAEFDDRQITGADENSLNSALAREAVYLLMYVKA